MTTGEIKTRQVVMLKPGDTEIPQEARLHDPVGGPLGGEICRNITFVTVDVHGTSLGPDTPVVYCNHLNTTIAIFNAFQCEKCHKTYSVTYMSQESTETNAMHSHSIRRGICKECWDKGRSARALGAIGKGIRTVLYGLAAPFITLPSPPPATPPTHRTPPKGTSVSIILALSLTAVTAYAGRIGSSSGINNYKERTTMSTHNTGPGKPADGRLIEQLVTKAFTYGLDNPSFSEEGPRAIMRVRKGFETGRLDARDVQALARLVGIAERMGPPLAWRVEFAKNPPPDIIGQGDIHPFTLLDGTPVGLSFLELTESVRFTGRPGSTKTTGSCAVIDPSIKAGISTVLIESKGDGQADYLMQKYPGRVIKVRVGRPDQPFFNPWIYYEAIRAYFLQTYSRHDSGIVLNAAIKRGIDKNSLTGASELTHSQLIKLIAEEVTPVGFPKIPPQFFRSMFNVFQDIQTSPLSYQIRCQRGFDLAAIIENGYSLIIDTSAIAGSVHEEFLVVSLLEALRQEIRNSPVLHDRRKTQVIFYLDEGTVLASTSRTVKDVPPLVHLSTLVRASSICLFAVYHSISQVNPTLNSAGTWFVAQISDGNDMATAKRTFALTDRQVKALTDLPKGVAMMRMGNRYTEPFLVTYPRIPDPVKLTDDEVDANNAPILATLPPVIPVDFKKVPVIGVPPVTVTATPAATSIATGSAAGTGLIDNDYLAILRDINANPFLNVSKRAAQLVLPSGKSVTYKTLAPVLDTLKTQGFIGELSAALSPHAGPPSLMHFLLQQGHDAIGSLYKPERGDHKHDFVQRLVKHILTGKGIKATIEAGLPGTDKVVDLGVIVPVSRELVSIEIPVTTFNTEPDQARRDLLAGWTHVIEVCLTKADLARLEREFQSASLPPDPRITLCSISSLVAVSSLQEITGCPELVFSASKSKTKGV